MLTERPEVEIAMNTSPGLPNPAIWRSNTWSYPKSFAIAVTIELSVVNAIAGSGARSW